MSVQRLPSSYKIFHGQRSSASFSPLSTHSLFLFRNEARITHASLFPSIRIRRECRKIAKKGLLVQATSEGSFGLGKWLPASDVSISDVLWPSAGAFLAMAMLGRLDQFVASKGVSFTIAPLGAVCAVLFATPTSPAARKSNMFVAQIACAAFGVLAFSLFGPGWLARGASLAASIGFMIATGTTHPPAASLPLLFIDGAKLHKLHFWYALFPGAVGCLLLCLIQEVVIYSKNNFKF
ncbi:Integral membrane HPP family protein [Rhynchospora pubera]|uniref:Integral membrane HPP family protein n=1 Tax=Rhynchospora pubera TaxID=906938 RepID=A0AAV8AIC4_9POAL|nr:Integral membrane HPP family protein [Rhynchospora pubera]KAJ4789717.1 Integral membrane HPP family protein [Rhynchospora pubera]KAJ4809249.1 Integral membrane HPP family protein [Rhynchospora pubera]